MPLPFGGATGVQLRSGRDKIEDIVAPADFDTLPNLEAYLASLPANTPAAALDVNEIVRLSRIRKRRIAEAGAAVTLSIAAHEGKYVELTNAGSSVTLDVAALSITKTDGQPIEDVDGFNATGGAVAVQNGSGVASIPQNASFTVRSVNGVALVETYGIGLAGTAAGEEIVFDGTDDVRSRPTYYIERNGGVGADAIVLTYRMPWAFEIVDAEASATTNSFDYTVAIDGTDVTGLIGVTANSPTITTGGPATAPNTGAANQRITITLANATTATDWYVAVGVRRAGV